MKMTISRKLTTACALGLVMIGALGATPAMARHHRDDYRPGDYYRGHDNGYYRSGYDRGYYQGGDYRRDRGRSYYNRSGYYRCRDEGKGGAVIGAIAGGLLGNEVARQGDRTTGAVIGAAVGDIAGHAIDKGDGRRC